MRLVPRFHWSRALGRRFFRVLELNGRTFRFFGVTIGHVGFGMVWAKKGRRET